jgi:23S rRNA pseudouridine2605 synthase
VLVARAGLCSRREAERLIAAGEVQVNGKVVSEAGARAREGIDHVRVAGKLLHGAAKLRYFAYHKPVGCVSTLHDPEGRFSVGDVVRALRVPGLFPVGRLDYHSSGLLLLTNDGSLTERLTHPRFHVEKRYAVKVRPRPTRAAIEELRRGVRLRTGGYTAPAYVREIRSADGKSWIDVRIAEGRNQQIRRMFEAIGSRVEKLRRESIGPLELGDLEVGDARRLTVAEVTLLKRAVDEAEDEAAPARADKTVSTRARARVSRRTQP